MNTRRQFLSQSAMLTAGALLWSFDLDAAGEPTQPNITFPANPRDRLAVASYPFRDFIVPAEYVSASASPTAPKMELTEFAAHVKSRFNINKIEPWSSHFRSLDAKYLEKFRTALDRARSAVVNIAFDGQHSFYATDRGERERAIADNKQWIDAAVALGSPGIRTHVASADNQAPDLERCADTLLRIVEHAATRNVVVHLENDDAVTEDPVFLVRLIEKVNSPWLRALPDFGNSLMHKTPEDAYAGVESMFKHAYGICHVKQSEATGQGANVQVDLAYVFAILKKSGFRGCLSMEYDNSGDPYKETEELIAKSLQLLS
ncbi:MAG: sugar phosphate isomerase/epimerase [Acidobacteriia bacterium]|nr:sugar phosphate isomerase/epimerase [Terriglobia bacterium]